MDNVKKTSKNNKGFTMLELVITVALVSIFFGVVVAIVPSTINEYIAMRKLASAMELTNLIENGIATELSSATSICFDEEKDVITYIKNKEQRRFPSNEDKTLLLEGFTTLNEIGRNVSEYPDGMGGKVSTIEVGGKTTDGGHVYVFNSICDDGIYSDFGAKITIIYVSATNSYEMLVCVYDENDEIICSSQKPIIMYNDF